MSLEPMSSASVAREPGWQRLGAMIAAVAVILIPLVLVPASALFVDLSPADAEDLPTWAVEAFFNDLLLAWFSAVRLPVPVQLVYALVPLALPPALSLIGLGTVGRWAALAGVCMIGAVMAGVLGLGVLLELVAPGAPDAAVRLEVVAGLSWPLLALEACGCLLAASVATAAVAGVEIRADRPASGT